MTVPVDPATLSKLTSQALSLLQAGEAKTAIEIARRALRQDPLNAKLLELLGKIYTDAGRAKAAERCLTQAIALNPNGWSSWNNLARLLLDVGRIDEAVTHFDIALKKARQADPGPTASQFEILRANRAIALQTGGQFDAARQAFREMLAQDPACARAWNGISQISRFQANDPDIAAMEAALPKQQGEEERMFLHFALGEALMGCGQVARAFPYITEGNRIKRASLTYDPASVSDRVSALIDAFPAETCRPIAKPSQVTEVTPVFIVGMPRSGSTLLEQILSAHSAIYGAGEQLGLKRVLNFELRRNGELIRFPQNTAYLDEAAYGKLADAYFADLRQFLPSDLSPTTRFIIDKLPSNAFHVGMIARMFPKAKIIHSRRDSIDTCFSCFVKSFGNHQPQTYDLSELGRYHKDMDRLMAHWRDVLPTDRLLQVDYEAVVSDIEGQTQRLLTFLGLPWEAACTEPHKVNRHVRTASVYQVAQPIYAAKREKWRPVADQLQPLFEALGGEGR